MEKWVGIEERGQGYLMTLKARVDQASTAFVVRELLVIPQTNATDTEIAIGRAVRELFAFRIRDRRKKKAGEPAEGGQE